LLLFFGFTSISFYSNPSKGEVFISNYSSEIQKLVLHDIQGKVVKQLTLQSNKIEGLESDENGTYFIKVLTTTREQYFKITLLK
jgi:hypothetical protein